MNYQIILDKTLEEIANMNNRPSLLLHSCCGPCSSYVLDYLSKYFDITLLFYNPNIFPKEEYVKRLEEQKRLVEIMNDGNGEDDVDKTDKVDKMDKVDKVDKTDKADKIGEIRIIEGDYYPEIFEEIVKGMEDFPEGGERCTKCYELRLNEAAMFAKKMNFDYFTTTLSVSPMKNSSKLNEIGEALAKKYELNYLFSDFKKKEGYKRSIELSKKYGIYRQEYCGCKYSVR
ncbi:epoxyqueuosine reductase QueH [Bacteroidales bacterium OttesenSCG-928-L14]|nr:epoxyqueuosine reductase QueH [Bacteroidales bacterium OttesenSCG-928-L14]